MFRVYKRIPFVIAIVGLSLLGCGRVDSDLRSKQETKDEAASEPKSSIEAPEDFVIGEELNLNDSQFANLQARISYLRTFIVTQTAVYVKAATASCVSAVAQFNKIKGDLAAASAQTVLLQMKKAALNDIVAKKTVELTQQRTILATLVGRVDALTVAIANFGPGLSAKLAQKNREFNGQISVKQVTLANVRKQIDAVIAALPFDPMKYKSLDAEEDQLEIDIQNLSKQRDGQITMITTTAVQTLESLKPQLIAAKKELTERRPGLMAKDADLKREITALRKQENDVVQDELNNNAAAAKFVLPVVPIECGKLGIK